MCVLWRLIGLNELLSLWLFIQCSCFKYELVRLCLEVSSVSEKRNPLGDTSRHAAKLVTSPKIARNPVLRQTPEGTYYDH